MQPLVGSIPHRVGHGETGGDPIKLYEYLAAGLPVVTTRIDGWERWGSTVNAVGDDEEAIATISGLVSGNGPRIPIAIPQQRTWTTIAERVLEPLL